MRNGWDHEEVADHLSLALEGEPMRIIAGLSTTDSLKPERVLKKLTRRDTAAIQLDLYQGAFDMAKREKDEPL